MNLPEYMTTCYFCMKVSITREAHAVHLDTCEVRAEKLKAPEYGLHHVSFRSVRNLLGEVVFATRWKTLMETPCDDEESTRFACILKTDCDDVTQRDASLASSLITWLGTNCGLAFLSEAKKLANDSHLSRSDAYLAQWAIDNYRRSHVNSGMRMTEHFLSTVEPVSSRVASARDHEVLDSVAYWLGSKEGQLFIDGCERVIYARRKGLSDYDMERLGLTV